MLRCNRRTGPEVSIGHPKECTPPFTGYLVQLCICEPASFEADQASISAYQIGEAYALRRDPGAMFHWLDRAWDNRDPGVQALLYDPMILRYRADPRFAAFCRKVGLPATTDAVAME